MQCCRKSTILPLLLLLWCFSIYLVVPASYGPQENSKADGTMYGDVYNWADMIQNYIQQLADEGIRKDYTQSLFDKAEYTFERMNGTQVAEEVRKELESYFSNKMKAARKLAMTAVNAYDAFFERIEQNESESLNYTHLEKLPLDVYRDSDIPKRLDRLTFSAYFKQSTSEEYSTVKIADEVPRDLNHTIFAVQWTKELENLMKENRANDKSLRWQYFGTTAGVTRLFPGRGWSSNFVGFYNDYDPRVRPWYIAATSGPKDVVIVIDCSLSMKSGEKFGIAKAVAKAIIFTLTKQDYLNVVCARASHWDEVGKWHYFKSEVLSCRRQKMVPATLAHRKDLIETIDQIEPGGTSELEHGFHQAFDLLQSNQRTACQSIVVFVTDGKDTDGESVRCGPGYYTRSGYVPGPVCKYNWTKVWSALDDRNKRANPQARVFSYLIKDDGEIFPGHMACKHRGSLRKLVTGENLISQLSNYFDFLSKNAMKSRALWTAPYLDSFGLGLVVTYAVPAISKRHNRTIGVAGVDATLEELENLFTKFQWGSVTSFLINKQGQTIFHPLLKASATLKEDPIYIPIERLEQDKEGNPKDFVHVVKDMLNGTSGMRRIENARRGTPKGDYRAGVKYDILPLEYYYATLEESDYAFALILSDADKTYRRLKEPREPTNATSYFNLLIEYNSTIVREKYPNVFDYLQVKSNEEKYPNLRVTYLHSSIMLAPKCHCDPNVYFFDDNLAKKTLDAHSYMNSLTPERGCQTIQDKYEKGTRAYVMVTQPVENLWRTRDFESIKQVKWTYVGMRSGVFRTYPGHRSTRLYDPTKRPWYRRTMADPSKISISTPYMDAAGSGKIITISQAVFEGMQPRTKEECQKFKTKNKLLPGGCPCDVDENCQSGKCYISDAPGPHKNDHRCATERIEAITSLDIGYVSFHTELFDIMKATDPKYSCDQAYPCPDGSPGCFTKCYIVDNRANVIVASEFINATALDTGKYTGVTLGKKEGEIMKELVFDHKFFNRTESIDFQGTCSFVPNQPKVTLTGIPKTPEEEDNYYKTRGPIPSFSNSFGCIQDVVSFTANINQLGPSRMIVGNVSGPCMSGFYYLTNMPATNLFLLVIENWRDKVTGNHFPFHCHIVRRIVESGAYRIINGTCAHEDTSQETLAEQGRCPILRDIEIPCEFNSARSSVASSTALTFIIVLALVRSL